LLAARGGAVSRKSQNRTELIRLDHGGAFGKFSALVLREERRLTEIEKTLCISSPDNEFRNSLIQGPLWGFYRRCLPKVNRRKALKQELRKAARSAESLETLSALIWDADDPARNHPLLSRFGEIGPKWRPVSRGFPPWVDLLREYAFTLRLLGDTLPDDRGGEHTASAFDALLRFLWLPYCRMAWTHDLTSDFLRFAAVVTDLLRSIEPKLPAASFKLPPSDDALAKRLQRLGLKRSLLRCHAVDMSSLLERVHLHIPADLSHLWLDVTPPLFSRGYVHYNFPRRS
jgi:hypothetical protein